MRNGLIATAARRSVCERSLPWPLGELWPLTDRLGNIAWSSTNLAARVVRPCLASEYLEVCRTHFTLRTYYHGLAR